MKQLKPFFYYIMAIIVFYGATRFDDYTPYTLLVLVSAYLFVHGTYVAVKDNKTTGSWFD